MFETLDPRSPVPLYAQIASRLRLAIATGEVRAGATLPSVRQLSAQLRVNPATVVQAYRALEQEGLTATRHGAGTFVQAIASERRDVERAVEARRLVRQLLTDAARLGISTAELHAALTEEIQETEATRAP